MRTKKDKTTAEVTEVTEMAETDITDNADEADEATAAGEKELSVLAVRLKQLRKEFGMTQKDMAEQLGIARSGVANWERDIRIPGCNMIMRIAELFDVSADYVSGLSDSRINIPAPEPPEFDMSKLNSSGSDLMHEFYDFLCSLDKYSAESDSENTEKNS